MGEFQSGGESPKIGDYTTRNYVFYTNISPSSVDSTGQSGGRLGGWARICSVYKEGRSVETFPAEQTGGFDGWAKEKVKYTYCPVEPNVSISADDNVTVGEDVGVSYSTNKSGYNKLECKTNWGGGETHDPTEDTVGERTYTVKCKNGLGQEAEASTTVKISAPACVDNFNIQADRAENPDSENYVTSERPVQATWAVPEEANNGYRVTCNLTYLKNGTEFYSQNMTGNTTGNTVHDAPVFAGNEFEEEKQRYEITCKNEAGDVDTVTDNLTVIPAPEVSLSALGSLPDAPSKEPRVKVDGHYAVIGNDENPIELAWSSEATTRRPGSNTQPCNVNNVSWTNVTDAIRKDQTTVAHPTGSGSTGERSYTMTCQNWLNATVSDTAQVTSLPPLDASCSAFPRTVDSDTQSFMNVNIDSKTSGGSAWNYVPFTYMFDRDVQGTFENDENETSSSREIRKPLNYEFENMGRRGPEVRVKTDFQQGDEVQVACGNVTNLRSREVREVQP